MSAFVKKEDSILPQKVSGNGRLHIPFDSEYTSGAVNAIRVCLRVQPLEKVCVITDEATQEIAASIVLRSKRSVRPIVPGVLEQLAQRPLTDLPREILDHLETSQVSIFAVQAQRNELKARMPSSMIWRLILTMCA